MKGDEKKRLQEYAFTLYRDGHFQKEIAKKIGVNENTIKAWKEKLQWDSQKASFIISKEQELIRIYAQINELNTAIASREEGTRYASSKEADSLTKLAAAAKSLEGDLGLSEIVNVSKALLDYIKPIDFEAGEILSKYIDMFIRSTLAK